MEKCYPFKGQSLENGLSCLFQALGHTLKANTKEYKGLRETDPIWSQIPSSLGWT